MLEISPAVITTSFAGVQCITQETSVLLLVVTLCFIIVTCSVLSFNHSEPVPLLDRGEEQRGSEDPVGERGRGVEGLL